MKTFQDFIAERYYEPDEPLPSGKTPYGKATSSYYRQRGEFIRNPKKTSDHLFRATRQASRRNNEVHRGADNPDFDWRPDKSGKYDVSATSNYRLTVRDRQNDLEMRVRQKDQIAPGKKPVYDVEWYNNSGKRADNPGEARAVTRKVADMWKNQVAPRIPSNSVLTNFPISNDTSKRNTRSKFYSKVAGFGERGDRGWQYANVGRKPSPKQAAKGAQRITPLSGNLDPDWVDRRDIENMNRRREHKWGPRADEPKYFQGPRKIAPAKPSRHLLNQGIKQLKATKPATAPALPKAPKAPRVKPPVTPKVPRIRIKGGGRAALAGAALAGAGMLLNTLRSNKK